MAAKLSEANIVVLGNWNPAIFSPAWLKKYRVVDGIPDEVHVGVRALGRGFKFSLPGCEWEVDDHRLIIKADQSYNCGEAAKKILDLLSHTPVDAIGSNFVFKCEEQEWNTDRLPCIGSIRYGGGEQVEMVRCSVVYTTEGVDKIQITITHGREGVITAFNVHRQVKSAEEAAVYADHWLDDQDLAKKHLKEKFRVEVE